MVSPSDLEQLISPGRFATFVTLASANRSLAVDLYGDLVRVLRWTSPAHAASLLQTSRVPELLDARPC